MKKIIITSVLLAALMLTAASCVSRNPGKTDDTTTNLQDILSQIDSELKNPDTMLVNEVLYKVYDDHAEVIGCDTPVGEIKILDEYDGKKVTVIADEAFNGMVTITGVVIPEGVTAIGEKAFMGCAQLKNVTLPSTLKSIGRYAFYGCSELDSIGLPVALTEMGTNAFGSCTKLSKVEVAAGNSAFAAVDGVLFSADKATLVYYPTGRADKSYTIPESVKTVSDFAFAYAVSLESVSMTGVTSLGDYTFRSCAHLKEVDLGTGLTFLGASTFQKCTALTEIVIPEGVVSIGYIEDSNECGATFCDCTALATITLPSSLRNVYLRCFDGCTALSRVNYNGTADGWKAVVIGEQNSPLTEAGIVTK